MNKSKDKGGPDISIVSEKKKVRCYGKNLCVSFTIFSCIEGQEASSSTKRLQLIFIRRGG